MFSKGPVALCNERKPLGVACAACFEELAGVFASSVAMRYAKILTSLKKKNDMRQPIALGVLCSLIQGPKQVEGYVCKAPPLANTSAGGSQQAAQLSPGAAAHCKDPLELCLPLAVPAECLLNSGSVVFSYLEPA